MAWLEGTLELVTTLNRNETKDLLSVRKVIQRSLFIDNSDGSFLGPNSDALDVIGRLSQCFELIVNYMRTLNGSLCVELRRV